MFARPVDGSYAEYGVAYLHGKTLQERAIALISIAHPQFRGQLLRQAVEHNYVSSDLVGIEGSIHIESPALKRSMVLDNRSLVTFRPMHLTDEGHERYLDLIFFYTAAAKNSSLGC